MTKVVVYPAPEYLTENSKFEHLPPTLFRGIALSPSGGGKTTVLVDMLLRIYRGCFARVYVFSPSVNIDMAWKPVKDYVEHTLGVDPQKETCFFNTWDTKAIQDIVDTQKKIWSTARKRK
jgi:hypothetical protein